MHVLVDGGGGKGQAPTGLSSLIEKGTVLVSMGETTNLKNILNEAVDIATKLSNPDMIFEVQLLRARFLLLKNQPDEALKVLKNMEVDNIDEEQQALIAFETFRASGDSSQQQKAINQFNRLYQQTPKFIYKFHLEILKSDNEVAPST